MSWRKKRKNRRKSRNITVNKRTRDFHLVRKGFYSSLASIVYVSKDYSDEWIKESYQKPENYLFDVMKTLFLKRYCGILNDQKSFSDHKNVIVVEQHRKVAEDTILKYLRDERMKLSIHTLLKKWDSNWEALRKEFVVGSNMKLTKTNPDDQFSWLEEVLIVEFVIQESVRNFLSVINYFRTYFEGVESDNMRSILSFVFSVVRCNYEWTIKDSVIKDRFQSRISEMKLSIIDTFSLLMFLKFVPIRSYGPKSIPEFSFFNRLAKESIQSTSEKFSFLGSRLSLLYFREAPYQNKSECCVEWLIYLFNWFPSFSYSTITSPRKIKLEVEQEEIKVPLGFCVNLLRSDVKRGVILLKYVLFSKNYPQRSSDLPMKWLFQILRSFPFVEELEIFWKNFALFLKTMPTRFIRFLVTYFDSLRICETNENLWKTVSETNNFPSAHSSNFLESREQELFCPGTPGESLSFSSTLLDNLAWNRPYQRFLQLILGKLLKCFPDSTKIAKGEKEVINIFKKFKGLQYGILENLDNQKHLYRGRKVHSAVVFLKNNSFRELRNILQEYQKLGKITVDVCGRFSVFCYKGIRPNEWDEITCMARSLVLDMREKKIACIGFEKFFSRQHWEFNDLSILENSLSEIGEVTTKYDGSFVAVFRYEGKCYSTTKTCMSAPQAKWALKRVNNSFSHLIEEGYSYVFEAIYKENTHVVEYDFEDLVLLSIFDVERGLELDYPILYAFASRANCRFLEVQYRSLSDVFNRLGHPRNFDRDRHGRRLSLEREGFVFKYVSSGIRVKIIDGEFIRRRKILFGISPLCICRSYLFGFDKDYIKRVRKLNKEKGRECTKMLELLEKRYQEVEEMLCRELYFQEKSLSDRFFIRDMLFRAEEKIIFCEKLETSFCRIEKELREENEQSQVWGVTHNIFDNVRCRVKKEERDELLEIEWIVKDIFRKVEERVNALQQNFDAANYEIRKECNEILFNVQIRANCDQWDCSEKDRILEEKIARKYETMQRYYDEHEYKIEKERKMIERSYEKLIKICQLRIKVEEHGHLDFSVIAAKHLRRDIIMMIQPYRNVIHGYVPCQNLRQTVALKWVSSVKLRGLDFEMRFPVFPREIFIEILKFLPTKEMLKCKLLSVTFCLLIKNTRCFQKIVEEEKSRIALKKITKKKPGALGRSRRVGRYYSSDNDDADDWL